MDLADAKADNALDTRDVDRLLTINDMVYTRGASVSCVVVRQQKQNIVDSGQGTIFGPGQRIFMTLQTGTDFIDPLNSYLQFKLGVTGGSADTTAALFGSGALRLFSDSVVTPRAGPELDRCERMNVLNYHLVRGESLELQEANYNGMFLASGNRTKVDELLETPVATQTSIGRAAAVPGDGAAGEFNFQTVTIPLKWLSPIFNSAKLMPPHLARGLKLSLTCAPALEALVNPEGIAGAPTYQISDVQCILDSHIIADSVLNYLNTAWASTPSGLVYEWKSFVVSPFDTLPAGTTTLNLILSRALSMALDAFVCVRESLVAGQDFSDDKLASTLFSENASTQWRIGSTYLPSQNTVSIGGHYANMLYWMGRMRADAPTGTNYLFFKGGDGDATTTNYGLGKFCCVLNRSGILDQAGQALNNSSSLSCNVSGMTPITALYQGSAILFCRHLRRAICFIENVVLEM